MSVQTKAKCLNLNPKKLHTLNYLKLCDILI